MITATVLAVLVAPAAAVAAPRGGYQQGLDRVAAAGAVSVLAEIRGEHGTWRGTSGVAALGSTRPVPVDGRFRAGSITKTFLATVVLQLAAEGRLRVDDPIEKWLPGTVPGGDRISLRQLLNHTSGVPDVLPVLAKPPSPEFFANRWRTWTATEQIRLALTQPFTGPRYSNTGYLLLGQVVEKVTGRSPGAEIERRIIRPLRLRGTSMPGTSPWIPGPHPRGYVPGPQGLVDFTEMNPSLFGAAGELISTTSDLRRFFDALLGGRLMPALLPASLPASLPALLPASLPASLLTEMRQGLGLATRVTTCGIEVYGHDGDALTYQSWSYGTADRRRQVTVALTPNFTADPDDAVDAFLDEVFCR
ncbi:beta-lactamase family protein [Actinoplanes sp. NBC_00393]|uniref:serine hydrolase domain-containing protein n=1 Tax=Actinoplanes sp. NBC_00393 TaxID=2975953 RepID=UPI002E20A5CC